MATSETSAEVHRVSKVPSSSPKVSIVIPAFNEAIRIGDTIRKIEEFLARLPFKTEVLIIDDGSPDETAAIVRGLEFAGLRLIRNETNHGKGYAVRMGTLAATGEYVLLSDADLSAPIEEMEKLLSAAETQKADVVIGSRAMNRSLIEIHQSRKRELGGIVFNRMVRLLLGLDLQDTQCGFKLFKREKIRPVFEKLTIWGFGFDPELLFLAKRAGLKILEIPVRWSHADGSKIRFLRDGIRMFTDLIQIRWNSIRGRYS
jgi:glycosyltransferase involved in cell wall biosynthesis